MFGGDPNVIGRRVEVFGHTSAPIVGVLEEGFTFPRGSDGMGGFMSAGVEATSRSPMRTMLARLKEGSDLSEVEPIVRDLAVRHVASDREALRAHLRQDPAYRRFGPPALSPIPVKTTVARYYHEPIGSRLVSFVWLVIACGFAVALIAAANVVNLLLVRGAARRQEIAVRMALGAERAQIIRGLVMETGLVAVIGIAFGFLIALWQWRLVDATFDGSDYLGQVDATTLPIAVGAGLVLTLLVGVWPGVRATSLNLEHVLRDTRRAGLGSSPIDNILGRLVAASTAGTVMLLVCAAMLSLSARDWITDNIPMGRKGFISRLTLDDQSSRVQRAELAVAALGRLRRTAGVQFAALGTPPENAQPTTILAAIEGQAPRRLSSVGLYDVSDKYFDAMRIRQLQGRTFTPGETRDSTASVVVSRSVASALFGAGPTLGRRFRFWSESDSIIFDATVVGVVENLAGNQAMQQIYRAFGTLAPARTPILVSPQARGEVEATAISKALRDIPRLLSSDVSLLGARQQYVWPLIRYMLFGFTLFAAVGVVLAAIGTYGIVAYSVARRTHEIGVRIALGAQQTKVTWMILEQGLKITVTGVIFGLFLSYLATRVLSAFLTDVRTDYSLAIPGVVMLVLVISLVASWIPGYRAGRLNPVDALRAE
jgi:putative ABC transport system permease protein